MLDRSAEPARARSAVHTQPRRIGATTAPSLERLERVRAGPLPAPHSLFLARPPPRPPAVLGRGADAASQPPAVLFRAATSKRKISTVVAAADYARFHPAYVATLKAHTPALKKKVTKKKKKVSK